MLPTPQDLAQVMDQSRLQVLDRFIAALPAAAVFFLAATCVAGSWMCWSESHPTAAARLTHRRV